jgi:hypothetical protein
MAKASAKSKVPAKAKAPAKHRQAWTKADDKQLREEAKHNTPTRLIALHTGRTEASIRYRARTIGLSLKPTNQAPYGTKAKR